MVAEKLDTELNDGKEVRSRIRRILKAMAPDAFHATSPEHEPEARACSQLLNEISDRMKRGFDFKQWSPEVRERLPQGSAVTLVAMKDGVPQPPLTVRLNRPEVFVSMCEEYIATGNVSQELIDDVEEEEAVDGSGEFDEEDGFPDTTDKDAREFQDLIRTAGTVERLQQLVGLSRNYSFAQFDKAGIFTGIDSKAKHLIEHEIQEGSVDSLQRATHHVETFPFTDKEIQGALSDALHAHVSSEDSRSLAYPLPSDLSKLDRKAMATRSIEDLASIAHTVADLPDDKKVDAQKTLHSIDTLAKTRLVDACKKPEEGGTFEAYRHAMSQAQSFPFSQKEYGEDVRAVIETRAKYFLLSQMEKAASAEDIDAVEREAGSFPFSEAHQTDLNNEFVIVRERQKGNEMSVQHVTPLDRHNQEARTWINPMRHWVNRLFGLRDR